ETWSRARPWARRCSRCERSNPRALSAVPLGRPVILPDGANPTGWNFFGNLRSEDTPLRHSLPRAQGDERIEYHPVDLQALAECALARAKCPLGRNADVIEAGLPWRCLDALDQLRHLPLECLGWPKEVGPEGDEQIAVVAP